MRRTRLFNAGGGFEYMTWARDRMWRPSNSKRPIIFCMGAAGRDDETFYPDLDSDAFGSRDLVVALTERGFPVFVPNTENTFGNDAAMTRVSACHTWLSGTLGLDSNVILLGGSQGCTTACAWAQRNPATPVGMAYFSIVPRLDLVHSENRGGLQAAINAAYGSYANAVAAWPTRNPQDVADELTHIDHVGWYSTDDPYAPLSEIAAFETALGADFISTGAGGHGFGPTFNIDSFVERLLEWN